MNKTILTILMGLVAVFTCYAGVEQKEMTRTASESMSDAGFYIGAYGGADFATTNDSDRYKIGNVGPTSFFSSGTFSGNGDSAMNNIAAVAGLKLGYDFDSNEVTDGLRLQPGVELEGLYIGGTSTNSFSYTSPETIRVKSTYENAAVLVNGIVRFKLDCPITPYVGLGIGTEYFNATRVSLRDNFGVSYGSYSNANWVLAAQGLAGVEYKFAMHWSLFGEYKFIMLDAPRTNISNFGGTGANYSYRPPFLGQNIAVAGIKYSF